MASYHGTVLEFMELLRVTHSFTNVEACLGAWIYTPVAMEVIKTPEVHYLDG